MEQTGKVKGSNQGERSNPYARSILEAIGVIQTQVMETLAPDDIESGRDPVEEIAYEVARLILFAAAEQAGAELPSIPPYDELADADFPEEKNDE
jgi:hypothetical protein